MVSPLLDGVIILRGRRTDLGLQFYTLNVLVFSDFLFSHGTVD